MPTRRLFFAVLACSLALATTATAADEFHWTTDEDAGTTDLLLGEQPVLRYMHVYDASTPERLHETYKVFHHVFGPGSKTIITKGPGGKYTHHRGLFLGWNKTGFEGTSLDFWHCTKGAHLLHKKFMAKTGDAEHGSMTAEIHWNDAEGKPGLMKWILELERDCYVRLLWWIRCRRRFVSRRLSFSDSF